MLWHIHGQSSGSKQVQIKTPALHLSQDDLREGWSPFFWPDIIVPTANCFDNQVCIHDALCQNVLFVDNKESPKIHYIVHFNTINSN
jgi:hypothetical protein